ncbi:MAG: MazG nucleotide pyrophosphohydrolase domain-containing protein [Acidimicrobiales bacterium]
MSLPVVRVIGLGPGDVDLMTERARRLLADAPIARLRTRRHPAAASFPAVESYDDAYERASGFDELYAQIVDDLVRLADESPTGEVVYAVPGSPMVAERTVTLLLERPDVTVACEPAVSVIDLACAALGRDPMSPGLRVVDALDTNALRGPGPVLMLQAYAPEVLAVVASQLPGASPVTVLHHLGTPDQVVVTLAARDVVGFGADHLTSLWIDDLRDAGDAVADLVDLAARLRRECPWDIEQTHGSLTAHLLEEAYEAIDALHALSREDDVGGASSASVDHVVEELGDLLYHVVFHAELGREEARFDLATVADAVREKLTGRHPHVFADATARDSHEVEARWETLKRAEKGRQSAIDGVAWDMPALTLYSKLLRKAASVDRAPDGADALSRALTALSILDVDVASDDVDELVARSTWADAVAALCEAARERGVDLEGALRERALALADVIRAVESNEGANLDE